MGEDPYRSFLYGESEMATKWRHGAPPQYHLVNDLFQASRTKEWAKGSLEEIVQNVVKTWEMELSHKERVQDFKSIDHESLRYLSMVDENLKIVNLEVFYDPTQFLEGLTRGLKSAEYTVYRKGIEGCPLHQSIK